jgi:glycosyltransferase involved in cell wall biosynthesis
VKWHRTSTSGAWAPLACEASPGASVDHIEHGARGAGHMRIAMIGTRGVPARYGGFETAVEEVGRRLVDHGHEVVVYCRGTAPDERASEYLGMRLVHLPAPRRRSLETLGHTGLSVGHLLAHRTDVALVFNAANAPWLPVLRAARIPVATHVDGLEWRRGKWGPTGRRYYRRAESAAVRWSDALVADAQGIADYYTSAFGVETTLLTYGAPLRQRRTDHRLAELGLESDGYHLVVARFEPENHVEEIVAGYVASDAALPLVVVGSAPYADAYTARVHAAADPRVRFLGGLWDQELLDDLYSNARTYLHGHSVGGTNPSLLRAIGAGTAVSAYDISFNREVLGEAGRYFADERSVADVIEDSERDVEGTHARAEAGRREAARYDWDVVAEGYAQLCRDLAARDVPGPRRARRRETAFDSLTAPAVTRGIDVTT